MQDGGAAAAEAARVENGNRDLGSDAVGNVGTVEQCAPPGPAMLSVVVVQPEEPQSVPRSVGSEKSGVAAAAEAAAATTTVAGKKGYLPRSESYHEECRVCQQQTEEPLLDLGCRCRGELAKVHRSCIEIWFRSRGSNKCEICQQVAANIPSPESQPSTNYWIWGVDTALGWSNYGQGQRERACFSPLWVAFAILIGGLLLDVLISVSLGVSALPVNIIIGVLIVLGLGTALRLALECCHEWSSRRSSAPTVDMVINSGYHPAV